MWFLWLWLLVGFLSNVLCWIADMRGEEYDEDYFRKEGIFVTTIVMTLFGFFALLIVLFFIIDKKVDFKKLIYKIANIGIKKEK